MKNDQFNQDVSKKLDQLAQQHNGKAIVMQNVMARIEKSSSPRLALWKLTGYAMAAAIMGVVVIPSALDITPNQYPQHTQLNPKLSPQMIEDLEMLAIFAEDHTTRGS